MAGNKLHQLPTELLYKVVGQRGIFPGGKATGKAGRGDFNLDVQENPLHHHSQLLESGICLCTALEERYLKETI